MSHVFAGILRVSIVNQHGTLEIMVDPNATEVTADAPEAFEIGVKQNGWLTIGPKGCLAVTERSLALAGHGNHVVATGNSIAIGTIAGDVRIGGSDSNLKDLASSSQPTSLPEVRGNITIMTPPDIDFSINECYGVRVGPAGDEVMAGGYHSFAS